MVHGESQLTEAEHIRRHEFALMTAAYILVSLTKEGKSVKDIAKDFDNNLELVTVWIDYMTGMNWMYKDGNKKWIATNNGKKWVEKYYEI
jgi:transposase